jgi:hypothetical protein
MSRSIAAAKRHAIFAAMLRIFKRFGAYFSLITPSLADFQLSFQLPSKTLLLKSQAENDRVTHS